MSLPLHKTDGCRNSSCALYVTSPCLYVLWQYTTRVASFPLASTSSAPVSAPGRALQARSSCARRPDALLGPRMALANYAPCALARSRPIWGTLLFSFRCQASFARPRDVEMDAKTLSVDALDVIDSFVGVLHQQTEPPDRTWSSEVRNERVRDPDICCVLPLITVVVGARLLALGCGYGQPQCTPVHAGVRGTLRDAQPYLGCSRQQ
jgi:hypothetical protein